MSRADMSTEKAEQQPVLVVLCGPSHVGKTTFARRLSEISENFTIINPDEIRKQLSVSFGDPKHEAKVWDIYESMKCKTLKAGRNVVLDACHITEKARWHALQGPNQHHRKICVVFDLSLRTVMKRRVKEKRVPLREVERMWRAFQNNKPTIKELKLQGFDDVRFIREGSTRAMQFTWLGRKTREMKALYKVFCHKADRLMSAASSILLWAPPNLCMRARAAHVSDSVLWPSLEHFSFAKPTVRVGCRGTYRQRCFIFHHLRAGLSAWPEGQWFNNKEVNYG